MTVMLVTAMFITVVGLMIDVRLMAVPNVWIKYSFM